MPYLFGDIFCTFYTPHRILDWDSWIFPLLHEVQWPKSFYLWFLTANEFNRCHRLRYHLVCYFQAQYNIPSNTSLALVDQLLFIYIHSMIKASLLRFLFANFGLNCYCGSMMIIWNSNPIKNSFANCSLNYASSSFIFCLECVIT